MLRPGVVIEERESLLMEFRMDDGRIGWGEAAPLPGFSHETPDDVIDAARWLAHEVITDDYQDVRRDCAALRAARRLPSLAFGVDTALEVLDDGGAEFEGLSVATACLLQGDPSELPARAGERLRHGYRSMKLKVGRRSISEDVEVVRAIRAEVGTEVELRADANRSWSWSEAMEFAREVRESGLSYVEEPLRDIADLERFAHESDLPVALDETVAEAGLDTEWAIPTFASAVIVKPSLLGHRTGGLIRAAQDAGVRVVVSACYETGIGTAAIVRMALRSGPEPAPVGIGTIAWLQQDCLKPSIDFRVPNLGWCDVEAGRVQADKTLLQFISRS